MHNAMLVAGNGATTAAAAAIAPLLFAASL